MATATGVRRGAASRDAVRKDGASRDRGFSVRRLARDVVNCFEEHDLLTSASAISFQVLTAIVPFLLFALALLGFLSLGDVWRNEVAPEIEPNMSRAAFTVLDDTVVQVLHSRQVFWVTGGFVLAIWQISGAVRAAMGAMNRIYRVPRERSWRRRMSVSTALALAVSGLLFAAIAIVVGGPLLYSGVGQPAGALLFVVRWAIAGLLMLVAVGLLLRFGPAKTRPMGWVSFGTVLVIVAWIAMSIGFAVYLQFLASYESVFGHLATVVVLMGYIYLSALVFLGGVQVDALTRRRVEPHA